MTLTSGEFYVSGVIPALEGIETTLNTVATWLKNCGGSDDLTGTINCLRQSKVIPTLACDVESLGTAHLVDWINTIRSEAGVAEYSFTSQSRIPLLNQVEELQKATGRIIYPTDSGAKVYILPDDTYETPAGSNTFHCEYTVGGSKTYLHRGWMILENLDSWSLLVGDPKVAAMFFAPSTSIYAPSSPLGIGYHYNIDLLESPSDEELFNAVAGGDVDSFNVTFGENHMGIGYHFKHVFEFDRADSYLGLLLSNEAVESFYFVSPLTTLLWQVN